MHSSEFWTFPKVLGYSVMLNAVVP